MMVSGGNFKINVIFICEEKAYLFTDKERQ